MNQRVFIVILLLSSFESAQAMYTSGKIPKRPLILHAMANGGQPGIENQMPPVQNKQVKKSSKVKSESDKLFEELTLMQVFNALQLAELDFYPMPTKENSLNNEKWSYSEKLRIAQLAKFAYPIMSQEASNFALLFINHMQEHGTKKEKELYANMTSSQLIHRFATKRPLIFCESFDKYRIKEAKVKDRRGGFDLIGTDHESKFLPIENYMSYKEMPLSALLINWSTPTLFINNGHRENKGEMGIEGTYEPEGVFIGLIGPRLEKPRYMEYKHMVIESCQNTIENGYGLVKNEQYSNSEVALWENFYKTTFPTYQEAKEAAEQQLDTYLPYKTKADTVYLNVDVYKARLKHTLLPFLYDAQNRAKCVNQEGKYGAKKSAYVRAVGIGLGKWQLTPVQAKLMLDTYNDILIEHMDALPNVSDVNFLWFPKEYQKCGDAANGDKIGHINIYFSTENPADPLQGEDKGKLLVASFAYDSNAVVGNEYWAGGNSLSASGDPAAACCSLIPSLENPEVNTRLLENQPHIYPRPAKNIGL